MMPRPNYSKEKSYDKRESTMHSQEKTLFETKPNLLLYADNFILKFIVLFLLVFMFSPLLAIVYNIQGNLQYVYGLDLSNMTFIAELILIFCIIVVIIKIGLDYLDWQNTSYVLTDKRIIINRGFFNKESISMSYAKIQDIDLSQSLMERFFDAGDIVVFGGHDNSETILDEVSQPKTVESMILDNINKLPGYGSNILYNQNGYNNQQYSGNQSYNQDYNSSQYNNNYTKDYQANPNNQQNYNENYNRYPDDGNGLQYDNYQYNEDYSNNYPDENTDYTHNYSNNYEESMKQEYAHDMKEPKETRIDKDELVNRNLRKFKKSK